MQIHRGEQELKKLESAVELLALISDHTCSYVNGGKETSKYIGCLL